MHGIVLSQLQKLTEIRRSYIKEIKNAEKDRENFSSAPLLFIGGCSALFGVKLTEQ